MAPTKAKARKAAKAVGLATLSAINPLAGMGALIAAKIRKKKQAKRDKKVAAAAVEEYKKSQAAKG